MNWQLNMDMLHQSLSLSNATLILWYNRCFSNYMFWTTFFYLRYHIQSNVLINTSPWKLTCYDKSFDICIMNKDDWGPLWYPIRYLGDLKESRSLAICRFTYLVALQFDMRLGSTAADTSVKLESNVTNLFANLAALKLSSYRILKSMFQEGSLCAHVTFLTVCLILHTCTSGIVSTLALSWQQNYQTRAILHVY